MDLLNDISKSFWSTKVWLPPNVTWEDIAPGSRPDINYADYRDLIYPLPMAVVMLILRYGLEKYWFAPIGKSIGIKSTRSKRAEPNPILEAAYNESSRLRHKTVIGLMKQLDMTERQIERWWRYRRGQDKPSTLTKFCENSWRCLYYACIFIYGVIVLWDKPWLWNFMHLWIDYPNQSLDNSIWWYYMISMSFYWSLTASQFVDIRRKDFWQMLVHHMVTLLLIGLSYVCNLHRAGSLVLVIHDAADIFLEAAKITKYAAYQKICDTIFAVFTIVWIITRLGFFPRFIYSSSIEAQSIVPMFPAYFIFNSLLILLLILHIAWTYLILKLAHKTLKSGQMEGDIRSSTSDMSDSSENNRPLTNGTPKKEHQTHNSSLHGADVSPKKTLLKTIKAGEKE